MIASLHMLRIELRRNIGLWLFPVMAGLIVWLAIDNMPSVEVPLWFRISTDIQFSALLLGPLLGGLAAWMATRNKQRRMDELLSTTPHPAASRDLMTFGATFAWGGLAYILGAAVVLMLLAFRAPWGFPHLPTLLVGLCVVAAQGVVGYAAGYYIRSRFTAPLIAVALWFSYVVPGLIDNRLFWTVTETGGYQDGSLFSRLSPLDFGARYSVFHGAWSDPSVWQAIWVLGLGGIAVAAVILNHWRAPVVWGGLLTAVLAASVGGTMLAQFDHAEATDGVVIPYIPVCMEAEQGVQVCLHPANKRILPEVAEVVGKTVRPFIGIPGGVERVEESAEYRGTASLLPDGMLQLGVFVVRNGYNSIVFYITGLLVGNTEGVTEVFRGEERSVGEDSHAQFAIQLWLFHQAGIETGGRSFGDFRYRDQIAASAERFAALDFEAQQAWLRDNLAALRDGKLTLDDLP